MIKPLTHRLKGVVKRMLNTVGLDVRLTRAGVGPGSGARPIGVTHLFYEDLAARGFAPRAVLDVGANRGDWTRMMVAIFPSAHYLMLEPQLEMAAQLEAVARKYENVSWLPVAAGAAADTLVLTIWDDLNGSSFLPPADDGLLETGRQRLVDVVPIDSIVEQAGLPVPELVKLDIQGYELEALKGASTLFGSTELFVLETSLYPFLNGTPVLDEVVAFMADRGYSVYDIAGFARRPLDGALGQLDLAFARTDGMLRKSDTWA